jgi:tRNA threonylcarbamoyladenosine biosynthesis protein TsaE
MTSQTNSKNAAETEALAKRLGQNLRGGEMLELVSDLGGGKTTFVRGLAEGFGSDDHVASPTFTVSKVYKADGKELHHFDFYRLNDAGIMAHELHDLVGDPEVVVITEWGEVVQHVLPDDRMTVKISRTGEDSRTFVFEYPEKLKYLLEGVC